MRKLFTFLFAALMSVGMWAETVTWNSSDLPNYADSFSKDGVKLENSEIDQGDLYGGGTFTTTLGNFTKIEVTAGYCAISDWPGDEGHQTWTGNAASVSFDGSIYGLSSMVFTIEPACGPNMTWNLSGGVLTISGSGAMDDYDGEVTYAPWFSSKGSITSVIISNGVTSIGKYAFNGCTGLTSVTIPNSVISIGDFAFGMCSSLASIEIPNSVISIGDWAFAMCSSLASVTINATTPPTLGSYAFFSTAEGLKIYVPAGSEGTYKDAENWSAYAGKIEAIIIPNVDPENPAVYYSTFYASAKKYELPEGVEAYVATIGENALLLTRIAVAGQVIPNDNAVILKSTVKPFTLTPSEAAPVTFTVDNSLEGTDDAIATPSDCYVLGGADNVVGFYRYSGSKLKAHKAYVIYAPNPQNPAPRRMPFIFDQATGVENVQMTNDERQTTKLLRDGQLIIIRNGVEYNANGMMVK